MTNITIVLSIIGGLGASLVLVLWIKSKLQKNGEIEYLDQTDEDQEEYKCSTCDGTGYVTENAGCCGACEICGSREEREVRCPDCNLPDEETESDQ